MVSTSRFGSQGSALDTTVFTRRIPRAELRAFWRYFRATPGAKQPDHRARTLIVAVGLFAILVGMLAMAGGLTGELASSRPDRLSQAFGMGAILLLLAFGGVSLLLWSARMSSRKRSKRDFYRLAHFAADNGLVFRPSRLRGEHLTPWRERGTIVVSDVFRTRGGRIVEFGNYDVVTQHGTTSRSTMFGGYAATRIATDLPNIRLESQRVRRLGRTHAASTDQRLSLEGDFDRTFTLLCPNGYEQDALYLFTPDVMARLMDGAADFDVELIDDWIFLSSPHDIVTLDADRWRSVVAAMGVVTGKIAQWERWRDDRVPRNRLGVAGTVAKPGTRLRIGWGSGAVIVAFLGVVYLALTIFANAL